jgi:hypothetical protein
VESAEQYGSEIEGPEAVVDFFEADVFLEQAVADVDPALLPSDAAVFADLSDFEVSGVLGWRETWRQGSRGGLVEIGGRPVLERFVRPLVVELGSERIEAALLGGSVASGGSCGLSLQRPMHAFVTAVLLGMGGLDQLGTDPQADPPDREAREAADGGGCGKGDAVVGANDLRQAVLTKEALKVLLGCDGLNRELRAAGQKIAAVAVGDG